MFLLLLVTLTAFPTSLIRHWNRRKNLYNKLKVRAVAIGGGGGGGAQVTDEEGKTAYWGVGGGSCRERN